MILAAMQGHAALLPRLVEHSVPLEAEDEAGFTAFLFACLKGHARCAEALLRVGCDATALTNMGRSGLMLAAIEGHVVLLSRASRLLGRRRRVAMRRQWWGQPKERVGVRHIHMPNGSAPGRRGRCQG